MEENVFYVESYSSSNRESNNERQLPNKSEDSNIRRNRMDCSKKKLIILFLIILAVIALITIIVVVLILKLSHQKTPTDNKDITTDTIAIDPMEVPLKTEFKISTKINDFKIFNVQQKSKDKILTDGELTENILFRNTTYDVLFFAEKKYEKY